MASHDAPLDATTLDITEGAPEGANGPAPLGLTVVVHPDGDRIGAHATLPELEAGLPLSLGRTTPDFHEALGAREPLTHPGISRKPLWLQRRGRSIELTPGAPGLRARVDGQPLTGPLRIPMARVDGPGIGIELGSCALVWLHRSHGPLPGGEMVGASAASHRLLDRLARIAGHPLPVLLRGESGVGKELAARAVHRLSPRHDGPMLAVNVAALPPSMAAAELFGHEKDAFTGARSARPGWFGQAHGGTLFLDEIGELAADVQPLLLRALDAGQIQPVGGRVRTVDVRVVTATDADLEGMVEAGRFRHALFERISASTVHIEPLRDRPVDAGLLFVHFLKAELERLGALELLADGRRVPWLRPELVAEVMAGGLAGNAREVRRLATRVALESHDAPRARLPASAAPAEPPPPDTSDDRPAIEEVGPAGLTVDAVQAALEAKKRSVSATARALGVSRNTLVAFMRSQDAFNLASELEPDQIRAALDAHDGDRSAAARTLGVSAHGLKLRMAQLEMS